MTTLNKDAADRPEASYTPDMAEDIDTFKDQLLEAVANSMREKGEFSEVLLRHLAASLSCDSFGEMLRGLVAINATAERSEAVLWTIAQIMDRDNPALQAHCIAYAANMHGLNGGKSEVEIAEMFGVGRAAVSQRVCEFQEALGLPVSRGMKDQEAQEAYSDRQHEIHGTEKDPEARSKRRVRSAVCAASRILQWHNKADLSALCENQKATLKAAFARLKPVVDAVAML